MSKIKVLEFTEYPGLRHCEISADSGEEYYHAVLNNAFKMSYEKNEVLILDLDDTAGYAPSFLDETIGNLVFDFGLKVVKEYLRIISNQEPDLLEMLEDETYLQWEERRKSKQVPKKTKKHKMWYQLIDGKLIEKLE